MASEVSPDGLCMSNGRRNQPLQAVRWMTYSFLFKGLNCISGRQYNPGARRQVKRVSVSVFGRLHGLNNRAQALYCFTMIRACHKICCSTISFHYSTLWHAMFSVKWAILKLSVRGVTYPVIVLTLLYQSVLCWPSTTTLSGLLNILLKPSTKASGETERLDWKQVKHLSHEVCATELVLWWTIGFQ